MDFKDIISHLSSAGGINNFGSINFNDIHDNENVYISDTSKEKDNEKNEENVRETSLVLTPKQQQAFSLAVERGYMTRGDDGTYQWQLPKVLLAYFLGRLFCGDYISTDNVAHRKEWTAGSKDLPERQLVRLLGLRAIAANRRTRLGKSMPNGYEKIEDLIDEIG